jgi:hypothetical protein
MEVLMMNSTMSTQPQRDDEQQCTWGGLMNERGKLMYDGKNGEDGDK